MMFFNSQHLWRTGLERGREPRTIKTMDAGHTVHHEVNGKALKRDAALVDRLTEHGVQSYVDSIPHLERAFQGNVRACICCDGRISTREAIKEPAVYLPGANVFQDDQGGLALRLHSAGIKYLYSHSDCGAARARFGRANPSSKAPSLEELDKFAEQETRAFCLKYSNLGFVYKGHIDTPPLHEPHGEQILYFDVTPTTKKSKKFVRSAVGEHLPPGFKLTASLSENPSRDMVTLLGIAFGEHGAGNWLIANNRKFLVCVIGSTKEETRQMTETVRGWIRATHEPVKSHVIVDGFTAPNS